MADNVIQIPSRGLLKRVKGGRDGLYPWLETLTPDITYVIDRHMGEFVGDTIFAGYQVAKNGTGAADLAISAGAVNGEAVIDAGSADNGYSAASLGLHMRGDLNPVFMARVKVSAVATVKFEVGLTDVVAGTDAGMANVLATPTYNAADCVGWVFDTDDTAEPQCVGVENTSVATKIETSDILSVADDTYVTFVVALKDDTAFFYQLNADGRLVFESGGMTGAVTKTDLLTPWLFVQNRAGSIQRTLKIDYLLAWQRRTAN